MKSTPAAFHHRNEDNRWIHTGSARWLLCLPPFIMCFFIFSVFFSWHFVARFCRICVIFGPLRPNTKVCKQRKQNADKGRFLPAFDIFIDPSHTLANTNGRSGKIISVKFAFTSLRTISHKCWTTRVRWLSQYLASQQKIRFETQSKGVLNFMLFEAF